VDSVPFKGSRGGRWPRSRWGRWGCGWLCVAGVVGSCRGPCGVAGGDVVVPTVVFALATDSGEMLGENAGVFPV